MTRHVLAHVLPSGHPSGPRLSTPPTPWKAARYRMAQAMRETWEDARLPLLFAVIAAPLTVAGMMLRICPH